MNHLNRFMEHLSSHNELYWPSVKRTFDTHPELFTELGGLMVDWSERYLGEETAAKLADGYAHFVTDVNKSQMRYEMRGAYANKSYSEVYASVYGNADTMALYHWGVYVTTFAWEHHLRLYRFFRDYFVPLLGREGSLLDLGSGSGIWTLLTLQQRPAWRGTGADISATSVEFANRLAERNGFGGRAAFTTADALTFAGLEPSDACISCFLLEHLEKPNELLANFARNLAPRGYGFVTGALTAAEVDHITEFRRESELVAMAEAAGLRVISTLSASPLSYPEDCRFLPRSMAMVVQRRSGEIW